ncbi:hypothetical protein FQA39_LY06739 [Lamprigera yunnana]|nr:hypothetical protein FQA39_LY06739 [Lamprigera yunnana]
MEKTQYESVRKEMDFDDEHTNDDEDSAKETQFVDQDQVAGTSKDTPKRGDNENKRLPKKLPGGGPQKIQKTSATEEALSIMKGIQGRHTSGLDQFKTFGELVGLRIKDLPSSNAQKIVKHLISNILFEAEMGKYDHGKPIERKLLTAFLPNTELRTTIYSCPDATKSKPIF